MLSREKGSLSHDDQNQDRLNCFSHTNAFMAIIFLVAIFSFLPSFFLAWSSHRFSPTSFASSLMGWQQDYKQSKAKEILENVTTLAPHDSSFAWSSRFADDTTRHFEAEAVTPCSCSRLRGEKKEAIHVKDKLWYGIMKQDIHLFPMRLSLGKWEEKMMTLFKNKTTKCTEQTKTY